MADNTETSTLDLKVVNSDETNSENDNSKEESTSNNRVRLNVINSDDKSDDNSSTNTSVKKVSLNVINADSDKESVYSKEQEGGPGDEKKEKKYEPKFVESPSSMKKDARTIKKIDVEYYEDMTSEATEGEREWYKKNVNKYKDSNGEYYDVNSPDYLKTNETGLNEFGQPINQYDPTGGFNSMETEPLKMPPTNNYGKVEQEISRLTNSSNAVENNKGVELEFNEYVKASGISLESDFTQKQNPINSFLNIINAGPNESVPQQTIGGVQEFKSLPSVDNYIERIYGLPNATNSFYYKTPSNSLHGFEGNLYQLIQARNAELSKPEPNQNVLDNYSRAQAYINEKFNTILKGSLKMQLPKYMTFYSNGLDEESDELEVAALKRLELEVASTPLAKDLDYVAENEDGTTNYELTKENLEVQQIINQVLGGSAEADYTTTTTRKGTREDEGETFSYTYTHKKGVDLEYISDLRDLLFTSVKSEFPNESYEERKKRQLNRIEALEKKYPNRNIKELNLKSINKKGLFTVYDKSVETAIKNYINDRLSDRTSAMGNVLNLKEYELFYDPTTMKILRSGNSEDKVVKENYSKNGFEKIKTVDQMIDLIEKITTNEGTDLDYERPISVLNYINDLQFDIAVLSEKIGKKFPNLNNGALKQNAEAGEVIVNPKIIDSNDPLIMMYNDAITKRQMLGIGYALNADLTKMSKEGYLTGFGRGLKNVFRSGDDQLVTSTGYDYSREKFFEGLQDVAPDIIYDKDINPNGFTKDEINDLYTKSLSYDIGVGTPAFAQIIAEFALTRKIGGKSLKSMGRLAEAFSGMLFGSKTKVARLATKATGAFIEELATIEMRNVVAGGLYDAEAMSPLFAVSAPAGKAINKFYQKMFSLSATSSKGAYGLARRLNEVPKSVQKFSGDFIFKPGTGALVMTIGEVPDAVLKYVKEGDTEALHHLIDPRQFLIKGAQIISTQGIAPIKNAVDVGKQFVYDIKKYREHKTFTDTYKSAKTFFNLPSEYTEARNEDARSEILNKAVDKKLKELGINPSFAKSLKGSGITGEQMKSAIKSGKGIDALIEMAENNYNSWLKSNPKLSNQSVARAKANFRNSIIALRKAKAKGITVKELQEKYLNFTEYSNFLKMNNLQLNFLDTYNENSKLALKVDILGNDLSSEFNVNNKDLTPNQIASKALNKGSLQTLRSLGSPVLVVEMLKSYGVKPEVIQKIAGSVDANGKWNGGGSLMFLGINIKAKADKAKVNLNTKNGEKFEDIEIDNFKISQDIMALETQLKETKDPYTKNEIKNKIKQLEEKTEANTNYQNKVAEDAILEQKAEAISNVAYAEKKAKEAGQQTKVLNNSAELKAYYNELYKENKISKEVRDQQIAQIDDPTLLKKGQTVLTNDGVEVVVFNLGDIIKSADVTTGPHELVHPWVNSVIKRLGIRTPEVRDAFVQNFKDSLSPGERVVVEARLKKMGLTMESGGLEVFNAYAEGVATGEIDGMKSDMGKIGNIFEALIEGDGGGADVNFDANGFSPELGISIVNIINEFASELKNDRLNDFMTQDLKNWNGEKGKQIRQEQKSGPNGSSFIEVGDIGKSGVNDQFEVKQSKEDIARTNKIEGELNTYKELQAEYPKGSAAWKNYQGEIDRIEKNINTAYNNKKYVVDLLNGETTTEVNGKKVDIKTALLEANDGLINELANRFKLNDPSLEGLNPEARLKMKEDFKNDIKGEFMFILQAYLKGYPDMTLEQRAAPLYSYMMASFGPRMGRMLQEASGGEYNPEAYKAAQDGTGPSTGTLSIEDLQTDSNFDVTEKDAENVIIKQAEAEPSNVEIPFANEVIKPGGDMQIMVGLKNWIRTGNGEIKNLQENVLGFASEAIKKDIGAGPNKSDPTKSSFKPDVYEKNIRKLYPDLAKYIQKEQQFLIDRRWNPMYEAILTESGQSTSRISTFEGSEVAQYETFLLSEDRMVDFLLFKGEFAVDPLKKDGKTKKTTAEIKRETTNKISQRAIKFSQLVGIIKTKTMLTEAIANGGKIKIDGKEVELLSMFSEDSPIKTLGDLSAALKLYDVKEGVKEDLSGVQDQSEVVNQDKFIDKVAGVVSKEINSQFGNQLLYENAMARAEIAIENGNEEAMITKTMTARDVVNFRRSIVEGEYAASVDKSTGSQSFETEVKDELADVEDNKFLESRGVNNAKEFADKAIERVDVLNQKKNINKENAKYNFWTNAGKVVDIVKKKAYDKMMKLYAPYTFSKKMLKKTGTKKDGTPLKNPGSVFDYNYTQAGEGYRETGNGQKLAVDTDGNPVSVPYSSTMNYNWGSKLSYNIDNSKFVSYAEQNSAANIMLSGKVSEGAKNEALNKVSNSEDVKARKQIMKTGWGGRFDFIWEEGISEAERLDRIEFLGGMVKRQSSGQVSGWRAMSPIIGGEFGNVDLLPTQIKGGSDGIRQLEHGIPMLKFSTKALSYIVKGDFDGLMKHCDAMEGFFADKAKLSFIDNMITKTPGGVQSMKGAEIYFKPDGKGGYIEAKPGEAGSQRLMDVIRIPNGKGGSTTIADAIDVAVNTKLKELNKRQAKDLEGVGMQGQVFNKVFQAGIDGVTIPEINQAVESVIISTQITKTTKNQNTKQQDVVLNQIEKVNSGAQEKKALENASTTNDQLNTATVVDKINETGGTQDIKMEHGDGSISTYNSKNKTLTQPNKTDKISTDYKVILLAGGAGSGKSTAAKTVLSQLDITKDMQMVNVDFFKEDIKKQLGLPGEETNYEDWQRSLNSKVMSIARKEKTLQQDEIVQAGQGFVLDGTLASYKVNSKTCMDLKNAGYEITILKADTSLKTSLERNKKRGEKGGRSLTDKIVVETHDKVNTTVEMMKREGYNVVETNTENFKEGEVDPNAVNSVKNSLKANVITKIIPEVQDQVERDFESEANDMISNAFPDVPKSKISQSVADNIAKGKRKKLRVTPFSARHATPLLLEVVGKGDVKGYDLVKDLQEQGDYSEYEFNNYRAKVYDAVKGANKYARKAKLNLSKKVLEVKDKEGKVVTQYNVEDAVRIYNWSRAGYTAKELGIEQSTIDAASAYMKKNTHALEYSDLIFNAVNNGEKGYFKPYEGWGSNNIKQDLWRAVEGRRADFFTEFDAMYKGIFSEDNLVKIKAGMGKDFDAWWESVSDYHDRSITGRTMAQGERIGKRALNWFHGSTALALFGNVKSGFTQLISTTNFFLADGVNIYKGMRNMFTPEYFEALRYIYKSDYMKARGGNFNLAMKELTDLETRFKEKKDAAVQTSFAISGLGDRGAITAGGAIMMVQRIKEIAPLLKEYTLSKTGEGKDGGLLLMNAVKDAPWLRDYAVAIKEGRITNKEEYMKMIMDEVAIYSEKTQQSIYAGNLSNQQTKAIGKMTLSFMNTTIKYNNLFIEEKMKMDRGLADNKKAISRMSNYIGVQGALFAFASSGLGFILMDDEMDEDKKEAIVKKKKEQALWSMMYNIVDGTGISGKAITTIAKVIKEEYDYMTDDQKHSANILKAMMNGSPAISIKAQKLTSAEYDVKDVYKKWKATGEIDGDMIKSGLRGATKIFSFATNFGGPEFAMALMDKYGFIMDERYTFWQHAGVLMGWSMYSMDEDVYKNMKTKNEVKKSSSNVLGGIGVSGSVMQKQTDSYNSKSKNKKKKTTLGG